MKKFICILLVLLVVLPTLSLACKKHGDNASSIAWGEWTKTNKVRKNGNDAVYHQRKYERKGQCEICAITDPTNAWSTPQTEWRDERHSKSATVEVKNNMPWRIKYSCGCGWYAYSYFR